MKPIAGFRPMTVPLTGYYAALALTTLAAIKENKPRTSPEAAPISGPVIAIIIPGVSRMGDCPSMAASSGWLGKGSWFEVHGSWLSSPKGLRVKVRRFLRSRPALRLFSHLIPGPSP
jgi:hypothetical protein